MDSRSHTHVTAALRLCLHALLIGLLGLVVVRTSSEDAPPTAAVVVVAALMAALYAAGPLAPSVQPGSRAGAVWLAGLGTLWAALLVLSPDALWVAFPLYFLQLHI
ncbi:sensor histidine kinase, partial [Streptomyces virginiae]